MFARKYSSRSDVIYLKKMHYLTDSRKRLEACITKQLKINSDNQLNKTLGMQQVQKDDDENNLLIF